jgi:hypothetical protein
LEGENGIEGRETRGGEERRGEERRGEGESTSDNFIDVV